MERQRPGNESEWYQTLERAPRLSAVSGAVVNIPIGERSDCLESIKLSVKVTLIILNRLT